MPSHNWKDAPGATPLADLKAMMARLKDEQYKFPEPDPMSDFYATRYLFFLEFGRYPEANEPGGYIRMSDLVGRKELED